MSIELYLLLFLLCFAGSAFFSGCEIGVLSLNHARLTHLARAGSKSARLLNALMADMQGFLATVLVGSNLMNVALATLSAGLAQEIFGDRRACQVAWGAGMACLTLFFCEYLPKLFYTARPLRRTLLSVRPLLVAQSALRPLTRLALFLTEWIVARSGAAASHRFLLTREYIQGVVSDPKDGSRITAVERLLIHRVLALQTQTAEQVMTPLALVSRTTEEASLEACCRQVRDCGHVRLPVFDASGARCVGILNMLEVLAAVSGDVSRRQAREVMGPPFFVRSDVSADDLLPMMRKARQPMAIVRNEPTGAAIGIITEENILGVLTGTLV